MDKEYLKSVMSMIDVLVQRGAIRGEEIYAIAALRRQTEEMMSAPTPPPEEIIRSAVKEAKASRDDTNRVTKKNDSA